MELHELVQNFFFPHSKNSRKTKHASGVIRGSNLGYLCLNFTKGTRVGAG